MVTDDFGQENAPTKRVHQATSHKPRTTPPKIPKSTFPSHTPKSSPKVSHGKLMSMAERQALKGKPFKIVSSKSPRAPAKPLRPRHTSPPSTKSSHTFEVDVDDLAAAADPSSSDESIPAVRPAVKSLRTEALSDRTGNTKAHFTPVPRYDGHAGQKRKMSVRIFK